MAERRFSLCRFLRRKKKKEGPGTAPVQQPEEVEQPQPLQEDPDRDRTQEQDRACGRFRRAAQAVLKFVGIRCPKTRITPSQVMAQPDPMPSELMAKADGATSEGEADTDIAVVQRPPSALGLDIPGERVVSVEEAMKPDRDMEQRPPRVPKLAWLKEGEEEGPGAAPSQQPEEAEQSQPLQEDPGRDRTQEQDRACGRFRRAAQMVCQFTRCIWREETIAMGAGGMANSDLCNAETSAALLDLLVENGVSNAEKVPAFVRYIHRWLTANVCAERRLDKTLLALVEAHPVDVVVTLLRSAPCCDRAAVSMWRAIISLRTTAESVLTILALVLGSWPTCSMCTSDGDETEVFALAATVALWKILHLLCCTRAVRVCFPNLFVHLLFQVFFSTVQMPEEVDTLWRECRKQRNLPSKPNRFAVLTLKALLRRLRCESVLVALERKCGWDTLLNADTHHYAVGLLAREMGSVCTPWCCGIVCCLLELLSEEMCPWELPAMAFLVEALVYLDVRECGESVLQILSRHLWSECPEMRRQVLKGLVVLSQDAVMAKRMCSLTESLVQLLWDADGELVGRTVSVLGFLFSDKGIQLSSPTALQLAEALQPLFDSADSSVQLSSILLFCGVMMTVEKEGKKALKPHVHQSLLPLFFHCHDENQRVAEASGEALLCVAGFLKRKDLKKTVKRKELWRFSECLLEKDKRRAVEYLCQALPYLESPQEPVREAALRFIGMAGRYLRGQPEELQDIIETLRGLRNDISPAISSLALQSCYIIEAAQRTPSSRLQQLPDWLCGACWPCPALRGSFWLCCQSSGEA
ncbi:maestro heat-like repeat-containing protein family member 6 [Chiroxiphia lanceolata]|uniref:maestro heat-like repeat-containing protein family member 6 n=1 Tax=Chiroxiphia lanceolata TaxID=296741 RepID=UPI0013CE9AF6|nr:maestro heat-like repeat-containing protein family member 6 [Chiroxiphia lanceolata]